MTIRNDDEMKMLENTIDRCRRTVWLITADGKQYNLKVPAEQSQGIARMMNAKDFEEPELFASCIEDEMILFEFFSWRKQVA